MILAEALRAIRSAWATLAISPRVRTTEPAPKKRGATTPRGRASRRTERRAGSVLTRDPVNGERASRAPCEP